METNSRRCECLVFETDNELARVAARRFASFVVAARDASRFLSIALSGGRIANQFFAAAARDLVHLGGFGGLTHFFWADERCVPPDHQDSNYRIAAELLLNPLAVPPSQVHRLAGELEPALGARRATAEFAGVMARHGVVPPRLDLVLLGMGEDGHIASLFPQSLIEEEASFATFRNVVGPKPPPNRITMSYSTLAAAREVWVLVSGHGKEAALRDSLSPSGNTPLAQLVRMRPRTDIFSSVPQAAQ